MLRLLIPIISARGAIEAARHAVFLFGENRSLQIELLEILAPPDQGHVAAFHSAEEQCSERLQAMSNAVSSTQAVLEHAGVAFALTRVFGSAPQTTAAFAVKKHCDVVLVDASHLGAVGRWWLMARLWSFMPTPVTILHEKGNGNFKRLCRL